MSWTCGKYNSIIKTASLNETALVKLIIRTKKSWLLKGLERKSLSMPFKWFKLGFDCRILSIAVLRLAESRSRRQVLGDWAFKPFT